MARVQFECVARPNAPGAARALRCLRLLLSCAADAAGVLMLCCCGCGTREVLLCCCCCGACEIQTSMSRRICLRSSNVACFARPASMTKTASSIVIDVSAMFVARITCQIRKVVAKLGRWLPN